MQLVEVIYNKKLPCITSYTIPPTLSTFSAPAPSATACQFFYCFSTHSLLMSCPPTDVHTSSRKPSLAALAASHAFQHLTALSLTEHSQGESFVQGHKLKKGQDPKDPNCVPGPVYLLTGGDIIFTPAYLTSQWDSRARTHLIF